MGTIGKLKIALFGALFVAVLAARPAQASVLAIDFTNTSGQALGNPPFTLGWSFQVLQDLVVTDLGVFDSDQDGISDRYPVGLWDGSQNLLVSTIIPAGTSAPLDGKFRFQSVANTALSAGQTYYIGALFATGNDGLLFPGTTTGFTTASSISFLSSQFAAGGSLTFPGSSAGGQDPSYFGPNFKFNEVPEPATLLLFGAALAPMARRAHRRAAR